MCFSSSQQTGSNRHLVLLYLGGAVKAKQFICELVVSGGGGGRMLVSFSSSPMYIHTHTSPMHPLRQSYKGPLADVGTPIHWAMAEHQCIFLSRTVLADFPPRVKLTIHRVSEEEEFVDVSDAPRECALTPLIHPPTAEEVEEEAAMVGGEATDYD